MVDRLVAEASQKVAGDLQALREAFDLVTAALDTALTNQSNPDHSQDVTALADRLAAEAAGQAEAARERARAEAQPVIDELRASVEARSAENGRLTTAVEEARAEAAGLRAQLQEKLALLTAARAEYAEAHDAHKRAEAAQAEVLEKTRRHSEEVAAEIAGVREQLDAARTEAAKASAQRDAEAAQSEKMTAALGAVTTELQDAKALAKKLTAEAKVTAADLDATKKARDEQQRAASALKQKLDESVKAMASLEERAKAADAEKNRLAADLKAAKQASTQAARAVEEAESRAGRLLAEQADTIRKHAGSFVSASLERLLDMHERAAAGGTTDDLFAAIVDGMAAQFPRVALFRVQSNHLEGVRQIGFDVQGDISQVLIPRNRDSLVVHAVTSGTIETRSGRKLAESSGMPFGGSPEFGLALPLMVNDECVAVVYADDSGHKDGEFAKPELREKFARLLQCQAIPVLARLAAEAKVLAELDEYAGLLLKELEQTHAEEVAAKTPDADRRKNLKENLEYARRMFAQRAEPEGAKAAALFERRLFATVESAGDTPFCRDVLHVVGGRKRAARTDARAAGSGA